MLVSLPDRNFDCVIKIYQPRHLEIQILLYYLLESKKVDIIALIQKDISKFRNANHLITKKLQ